MASPDLTEKMPLGSRAALALFSYSTRVSALITLSSFSGASSQVIALKGIQLTDTIVLQRVLASLGIRLAKLMAAKDQTGLITLFLQDEKTINHSFDPLKNTLPFQTITVPMCMAH